MTYTNEVKRTESIMNPLDINVVDLGLTNRVCHAVIGFHTEVDEYIMARDKFDTINILEELGDMLWYIAILHHDCELDFTIDHSEDDYKMVCTNDGLILDGLDLVKKTMFYGKELDVPLLIRIFSINYLTIKRLIETNGYDIATIMSANIQKLQLRYPNRFNLEDADSRQLQHERAVIEDGLKAR